MVFIELTFKGERKLICANPKEINFRLGDYATFNVENGVDMGQITKMGRLVSITGPEDQITEISRKATEDDITHFNENRSMEESPIPPIMTGHIMYRWWSITSGADV